jgi:branched-subunit amino acid aminotransferase/4-amino-4-deoxychorismate lyase
VQQRPITADDLRGALEAMVVSTKRGVVAVTHVDGEPVADGEAGQLALALQAVLANDRTPKEGSARHVPVPYGGLTGMRSQLT